MELHFAFVFLCSVYEGPPVRGSRSFQTHDDNAAKRGGGNSGSGRLKNGYGKEEKGAVVRMAADRR